MKNIFSILLGFVAAFPAVLCAQELSPRAYWPAPEGTQLVLIGFASTSGDTLPDPSLPFAGVDSDINSYHFGYLRTLSLWGRTSNFIMELPYVTGKTSVEIDSGFEKNRQYQGMGDVDVTLSVNVLGAPSMTREGFADLRRNPPSILGGSVKIRLPTGQYNSDKVVNTGANRWAIRPQLGYIIPLKPKWLLEVVGGAWFYGDNKNFLGTTREQDPILGLETHLIHRFSAGFWTSLDLNYYRGGRSRINGQKLDDAQRDSKVGFTVVYPFAHKHAIKFGYNKGSLNDTDEDFDQFQFTYQKLL